MIEVISVEEAAEIEKNKPKVSEPLEKESDGLSDTQLRDAAMKKRRTINVALVGNPNCGKTSLFNFASGAHERVGNYSGVTVDAKTGHATFEGYDFNIVDLPWHLLTLSLLARGTLCTQGDNRAHARCCNQCY